jgi:hypothetical protein
MSINEFVVRSSRFMVRALALLGLASLTMVSKAQQGVKFTLDDPAVQKVAAVQKVVTPDLMNQPEILGTAITEGQNGSADLLIFVNSEAENYGEVVRALPPSLRGVAVHAHLTEPFRAFPKSSHRPGHGGGGGGVSHTARQAPPISLGTSGGWAKDLANGFCCGGTLGSLIQVNGVQYVMSNYHVLESDIVAGGNGIVATAGDGAIQPGLIDVACNKNNAQTIATLVLSHSLPTSNVDVAIAQVVPGMVNPSGSILEIGPFRHPPLQLRSGS